MPQGNDHQPSDKKEGRDLLSRVVHLVPLFALILLLLELALKLFGVIK